jgi:hypothetical protein
MLGSEVGWLDARQVMTGTQDASHAENPCMINLLQIFLGWRLARMAKRLVGMAGRGSGAGALAAQERSWLA